MTFRCDISASIAMQPVLDMAADVRYVLALLDELSMQRIERAGSARQHALQLKFDLARLDAAIDHALTAFCNCAEVQQSKTPEKWSDLTFDEDGHCSKCPACGLGTGAPVSRFVNGKKSWFGPGKAA